jgi:hypothetical protein
VDAQDRAALVARLNAGPARIAVVARAAEAVPGEWTPREVVGHLVAVETEVWRLAARALARSSAAAPSLAARRTQP